MPQTLTVKSQADLYKLTVKELQSQLELRGSSQEGSKDELVKKLYEVLELLGYQELEVDELEEAPLLETQYDKPTQNNQALSMSVQEQNNRNSAALTSQPPITQNVSSSQKLEAQKPNKRNDINQQSASESPKKKSKPTNAVPASKVTSNGVSQSTQQAEKTSKNIVGQSGSLTQGPASTPKVSNNKVLQPLSFKTEEEKAKERAARFGAVTPELEADKVKVRAQRFNLENKDLQDERKLNRAQRFNMDTDETQKLKKMERADRFQLIDADVEQKKQTNRQARFGIQNSLENLSKTNNIKKSQPKNLKKFGKPKVSIDKPLSQPKQRIEPKLKN